jgi:enoyl-CoA hydratase
MTELIALDLGTVATLTLDDPPLNIIGTELLHELERAIGELEMAAPDAVRAVVVTGRGDRAFSVGSNVKEF